MTSQEPFKPLSFLGTHNQSTLVLKVQMDESMLLKLIFFRFFPLTLDLNVAKG